MKTIAVIAELNPLHNGHLYLLETARARSGADFLIVLLSGDFVQRGEPALYDKYIRTGMALTAGADLILELPVRAATGSARRFAEGAAAILDHLGIVDELWFGSEAGSITPFQSLSTFLAEEPRPYRQALQHALSRGASFAAAQEAALRTCISDPSLLSLVQEANNRLGLEYCLALQRIGSSIRPCTVARQGNHHHDPMLSAEGFSSASALRRLILNRSAGSPDPFDEPGSLADQVPSCLHPLYRQLLAEESPLTVDDFSDMLLYALWESFPSAPDVYLDVPEELANRILQSRSSYRSFSSFVQTLKTKERTWTQIRRALLHILLRIPQDPGMADPASRVRLLGRADHTAALFSAIHKSGRLTLVSGGAALQDPFYQTDLFASHLYEAVRARKSGTAFRSEFSRAVLRPAQR